MSVRTMAAAVAEGAVPMAVLAVWGSEEFVSPHFAVSLLVLSARSLLGCLAEAEAAVEGRSSLLVVGACQY